MLVRVERKIMKHGSSGVLAIPKAYRDYYKLNPGVTVTGSSSEACTGTISCGLQSNVKRPASFSVVLCWTLTATIGRRFTSRLANLKNRWRNGNV